MGNADLENGEAKLKRKSLEKMGGEKNIRRKKGLAGVEDGK